MVEVDDLQQRLADGEDTATLIEELRRRITAEQHAEQFQALTPEQADLLDAWHRCDWKRLTKHCTPDGTRLTKQATEKLLNGWAILDRHHR